MEDNNKATDNMQSLRDYAKAQGATSVEKVTGPNGAFISLKKDGKQFQTLPVGGKSQDGSLSEYKILISDGSMGPAGQAIATVNNYQVAEAMSL